MSLLGTVSLTWLVAASVLVIIFTSYKKPGRSLVFLGAVAGQVSLCYLLWSGSPPDMHGEPLAHKAPSAAVPSLEELQKHTIDSGLAHLPNP